MFRPTFEKVAVDSNAILLRHKHLGAVPYGWARFGDQGIKTLKGEHVVARARLQLRFRYIENLPLHKLKLTSLWPPVQVSQPPTCTGLTSPCTLVDLHNIDFATYTRP